MRLPDMSRMVWWACMLALIALGLMTWSVLDDHPMALVLAMSVGQVLGTLSLLLFIVAVFSDLRAVWAERNGHAGGRHDR